MDISLHHTEYGEGEPLVLLHGNGEDCTYFAPQIEPFSAGYRVIAVDTRGHGGSPRGTAPFTLEQFALDLESFLDTCGIATAHLLGFSDGANIALLFALAHPERVSSLILDGGNLFPEGLAKEAREQIDAEYRQACATGDERAIELLKLMIDEPHIEPESLVGIDAPALVIAGTQDMIAEEHTRLIAASLPNARLCILEGSHFVSAENPAAFNSAVLSFLADTADTHRPSHGIQGSGGRQPRQGQTRCN